MQLTVKNFMALRDAEINLEGVALVAGHNGSGKTSLARALSLACGDSSFSPKYTKKEAGRIIHKGQIAAEVNYGEAQARITAKGDTDFAAPVYATNIALGRNFCDLPTDEAYQILQTLFVEKIGESVLHNYMVEAVFGNEANPALITEGFKKAVAAAFKMITEKGWDAAAAAADNEARLLKGEWRAATGENWGADKGKNWLPATLPATEITSFTQAAADAADARFAELAKEISAQDLRDALDDAVRKEHEAKAATHEQLQADYKAAASKCRLFEENISDHEKELTDVRAKLNGTAPYLCPSCTAELGMNGAGELVAFQRLTEAQRAECVRIEAQLVEAIEKQRTDLNTLIAERDTILAKGTAANEARAALANAGDGTGSREKVEQMQKEQLEVKQRGDGIKVYLKARDLHRRINQNLVFSDQLAPSGIRAKLLERALDGINKTLREYSEMLDMPSIKIDRAMQVYAGDHSYPFLSGGMRYAVNRALQALITVKDKSTVMIFDGIDIIQPPSRREGLIKLAASTGIPSLVTLSLPEMERLPNLKKYGMGVSYWLESGQSLEMAA